jgi:hypothetical protein
MKFPENPESDSRKDCKICKTYPKTHVCLDHENGSARRFAGADGRLLLAEYLTPNDWTGRMCAHTPRSPRDPRCFVLELVETGGTDVADKPGLVAAERKARSSVDAAHNLEVHVVSS